jgi:tellurite resistance protein TerC
MSPVLMGWIGFHVFLFAMLALDLGLFHRESHVVKLREALTWTAVWVVLALLFNAGLWWWHGDEVALQFLAGYLIEKSLSVDNLFVFVLIFSFFKVPAQYQHKVLFWGILGALIMRGLFIFAGVALLNRFHWLIYFFGGFLIYTALKMVLMAEKEVDPAHNWFIRLLRRMLPVTENYEAGRFFVRRAGKLFATPLLLVLAFVEVTDLIFALDSIPAILAISNDAFIVYTSNALAILGLRSLFFALAGVMDLFHYLKIGLAAILGFVGVKMILAEEVIDIPIHISLLVIGGILAVAIVASIVRARVVGHSPVGAPVLPEDGAPAPGEASAHGPSADPPVACEPIPPGPAASEPRSEEKNGTPSLERSADRGPV